MKDVDDRVLLEAEIRKREEIRRAEASIRRRAFLRSPGAVLLGWLGLGYMSLVPLMLGFVFLPSREWLDTVTPYGNFTGLLTSAIILYGSLKAWPKIALGRFKKPFALIIVCFLGFFAGRDSLLITAPMFHAAVAGSAVEMPYTVASGVHPGSRSCRSSIYLKDMPFMHDRLCNGPEGDMTGANIIVGGRGTRHGVWASFFRVD